MSDLAAKVRAFADDEGHAYRCDWEDYGGERPCDCWHGRLLALLDQEPQPRCSTCAGSGWTGNRDPASPYGHFHCPRCPGPCRACEPRPACGCPPDTCRQAGAPGCALTVRSPS